MEKLLIGEVIYRLRKEKGITQDQLANFIGVSTAAVSKWESGISYPDITLLPVLATFFNITIDTLLNFKVELSEDEVMNLFSECEKLFSSGKLEEAIYKSKGYLSKYPNSYYLKLRIGFLFTMYSWKSSSEEQGMKMIGESIELFEDVSKNCSNVELCEQALFQLGALYPTVEEEDKAVECLNKIRKSQLDPNLILTNIYIEKKELKKAREILQSNLYKNINEISLICLGLINSYMKEEKKDLNIIEKYHNLALNVKKALSPEGDSVIGLSNEYLYYAIDYLKFNETYKAIEMLERMVEDMKRNDINKMREFSTIWCFNEIPQGKRTITMNLYENMFKILEGKEFDLIRDKEEFTKILKELKSLEKISLSCG